MHDDYGDNRPFKTNLDPLRYPPEPGQWALFHGSQAQTLAQLARSEGHQMKGRPTVPLPTDFPPLLAQGPWWEVTVAGNSFFLGEDEFKGYLTCYVYRVPSPT